MIRYHSGKVLKAISRFQRLLGWLLCAFVLSAALDNVPDPPVIKPHHNRAASVCLTGPHHVANHERDLDRGLASAPTPLRRFDQSRRSESKPLLPLAPLLSQASDSSPPHFTL
jgi:hypothetical protein